MPTNRMVRFIPWSSQTKVTFPPLVYTSHTSNLNHLSTYHVTSLSVCRLTYYSSSLLFFDYMSLVMAYQHVCGLKYCILLLSYSYPYMVRFIYGIEMRIRYAYVVGCVCVHTA
jgi:hypothetical protein